MTSSSQEPQREATGADAQQAGTKAQDGKRECPICVMMREGGCETQFNSFMDCGIQAEEGKREYTECIAAFEAMRVCMQGNPGVFKEVLDDVQELARTHTEHPPPPKEEGDPAAAKS